MEELNWNALPGQLIIGEGPRAFMRACIRIGGVGGAACGIAGRHRHVAY